MYMYLYILSTRSCGNSYVVHNYSAQPYFIIFEASYKDKFVRKLAYE